MAEGLAEGKAEGLAEGKAEIARKMMDNGLAPEEIERLTGIPVSKIQQNRFITRQSPIPVLSKNVAKGTFIPSSIDQSFAGHGQIIFPLRHR